MAFNPNVDYQIKHPVNVIYETYGDIVSVDIKNKDLLKFGVRTTVGSGFEALMTTQGSETQETMLTSNGITHVVGTAGDEGKQLTLEYHTYSDGELTFGTQNVTLDGSDATTPVELSTACARANRAFNIASSALAGAVYFYEGGTRTDANTHLVIPTGEQQTQKAQTAISHNDYWIIANISLSVLSKTSAYAEARLEVKHASASYWRPITQNFSAKDSSGTIVLRKEPYIIVPADYDVRLVARTNTGSVDIAGGFSGYLASVIT